MDDDARPLRESHAGGSAGLVELAPDHPGFADSAYRLRRDEIARVALDYDGVGPVPIVEYDDEEHRVWGEVWEHLGQLHAEHASASYLAADRRLGLSRKRIPQLAEVNAALSSHSGFRLLPVAGLVRTEIFLTYLARRVFLSTQYVRHPSRPLYTPEPDVIHELVGHAATFAEPGLVDLNLQLGAATERAKTPEEIIELGRVYWYTLEFGVVEEEGELKAYGAGLLSSIGELSQFRDGPELRPLDLDAMAAEAYDPTDFQGVLWIAPSLELLNRELGTWLAQRQ